MVLNLRRQLLYTAFALFFILCSTHILPLAKQIRDKAGLTVNPVSDGIPPMVVLATTALGSFRGIFIDLLWLRSVELKEEGRFYEMVQVYDWITTLQPHYSKLWAHVAWDLAYNISVECPQEERYFWVMRGVRYLRDKGIPYNKYDPDLYFELAWIYHHKIGGDLDFALRFYRTESFREVERLLGGGGDQILLQALVSSPSRKELLNAIPSVQALRLAMQPYRLDPVNDFPRFSRNRDVIPDKLKTILNLPENQQTLNTIRYFYLRQRLVDEFNLDPVLMLKLNLDYGPLDWRSPDAHSLYWAYKAREVFRHNLGERADSVMDMKYERLIYFSLQDLVRSGRIFVNEDGRIHNLPDNRFIRPFVLFLQDLFERAERSKTPNGGEVNVTGAISGYEYALERCIFHAYFQGKPEEGKEYLALLQKQNPDNPKYQKTPEMYVNENIQDFVDGMSVDRFMELLYSKIWLTYFYLSIGDGENALTEEGWIKQFYEYGIKRWPVPTRIDQDRWTAMIPPLMPMKEEVLAAILSGRDSNFSPLTLERLKTSLPKNLLDQVIRRIQRTTPQALEQQKIK